MEIIADILLVSGAVAAGFYCYILGRRLRRFNDLEQGVGGAVAVLSAQVDDLTRTLAAAQGTAAGSAETLTALATRAEDISRRLEMQMASMHDLPPVSAGQDTAPAPAPTSAPAATASEQPTFRSGSKLAAAPATTPAPPRPVPAEPMFTRKSATGGHA